MDEDGDVADEFLCEVVDDNPPTESQLRPPKLRVNYNTRHLATAARRQVIIADGNIYQALEQQGRLQWVWLGNNDEPLLEDYPMLQWIQPPYSNANVMEV